MIRSRSLDAGDYCYQKVNVRDLPDKLSNNLTLRILGALCALIFLRALGVFICLCASHALIFSRALLAFLFYVLCVLSLFCVPSFLRAYILFMYLVITQINEHLSTFIKYFHFYKTRVLFCMIFPFFETKNFNYF